jgi:hypothetical protein
MGDWNSSRRCRDSVSGSGATKESKLGSLVKHSLLENCKFGNSSGGTGVVGEHSSINASNKIEYGVGGGGRLACKVYTRQGRVCEGGCGGSCSCGRLDLDFGVFGIRHR